MARILVIDDNRHMRELLEATLAAASHEVRCASNGKEGLALFSAQPADLVITDLLMPEKEGVETIMELRSQEPNLKIIAISGAPKEWMVLQIAGKIGAHKTLRKPFTLEEISEAVETLLKAQSP